MGLVFFLPRVPSPEIFLCRFSLNQHDSVENEGFSKNNCLTLPNSNFLHNNDQTDNLNLQNENVIYNFNLNMSGTMIVSYSPLGNNHYSTPKSTVSETHKTWYKSLYNTPEKTVKNLNCSMYLIDLTAPDDDKTFHAYSNPSCSPNNMTCSTKALPMKRNNSLLRSALKNTAPSNSNEFLSKINGERNNTNQQKYDERHMNTPIADNRRKVAATFTGKKGIIYFSLLN